MSKLFTFVKLVKICQQISKIVKLSNIVKLSKIVNNCQKKIKKLSKIVKNCQKLQKLSKIVKNCPILSKNCQKCKKLYKILKMLVRSCFLITVIKGLKGHRTLGSLFNVKKGGQSPIDSVWTAQKVFLNEAGVQLHLLLFSALFSLKSYLFGKCPNLFQ